MIPRYTHGLNGGDQFAYAFDARRRFPADADEAIRAAGTGVRIDLDPGSGFLKRKRYSGALDRSANTGVQGMELPGETFPDLHWKEDDGETTGSFTGELAATERQFSPTSPRLGTRGPVNSRRVFIISEINFRLVVAFLACASSTIADKKASELFVRPARIFLIIPRA